MGLQLQLGCLCYERFSWPISSYMNPPEGASSQDSFYRTLMILVNSLGVLSLHG